jgi:Tol biopolymer transport system component
VRADARLLSLSLSAGLLATLAVAPAAEAAFPGSDGRIAFDQEAPAGDHTQTDIYTVKADGSGLRELSASANQNEFGPAYNAAGTRIAFWRTPAPFGPGSLWVMDADGSDKRRLTAGIDARDPAFNPAGTRLAYTGVGAGGDFDIWTLRVSDGTDRKRVTSGSALDFEPAWSPAGTGIAFTRGFATGDTGDVQLVDVATGAVTPITASPAYDHQAAWAPSAARLVFERDFSSSSSIFTVNANGSNLTRLTTGPFFDTGPAFSPRATRIAFGADRGGALFPDLWLMRPDGSNLHRLIELEFAEGFPDWQPAAG